MQNIGLNSLSDYDLKLLCVFMLLYADDMVVFSTDPNTLQDHLYCVLIFESMELKINTKKVKICAYGKGKSREQRLIYINDHIIDIVDGFAYLGVTFFSNGNIAKTAKILFDQALKAMYNLSSLLTRIHVDIIKNLKLLNFPSCTNFALLAEVWGIYCPKEVDSSKIHIKFCKLILGVKSQTPNSIVLDDVGRFPLSVICQETSLKYYTKLKSNSDSFMYKLLFSTECNSNNDQNWAVSVKI
jgi:hypothetical protein